METTTATLRRQPSSANTFGVFAGALPHQSAFQYTTLGWAGHSTQFEERVASLINSPCRVAAGKGTRLLIAHRGGSISTITLCKHGHPPLESTWKPKMRILEKE
jgi:hypothetical protein